MSDNQITLANNWIEKKASNKYYPYFLGLFLMLCSLIFAKPDFTLHPDLESEAWETMVLKSNDLTSSLTHIPPGSWLAKKVFRLTIPIVMRVTHLSPLGIIALQYILGYLLLVFGYKLSIKTLKDSVSATYLISGIVFLYFGRACFFDFSMTWFDGTAFFCLIMALYSVNIGTIFLFSTLAAWTDERAFIALSIVFVFHQLRHQDNSKINLTKLFKLNKNGIAVLMAIFSYIIIRVYLTHQFNMHTPSTGANFSVLKKTISYLTLGVWTSLEGFWLIFVAVLAVSATKRDYLFISIILAITALFILIAGCVTDTIRSGSYLVPIVFVIASYLYAHLERNEIRLLFLFSFVVSFLFPAILICLDWQSPIIVSNSVFIIALHHVVTFLTQHNFI